MCSCNTGEYTVVLGMLHSKVWSSTLAWNKIQWFWTSFLPFVSILIVSFPGEGQHRGKEGSNEQEDMHYPSNLEPGIFLDWTPDQHKNSLNIIWRMINGSQQNGSNRKILKACLKTAVVIKMKLLINFYLFIGELKNFKKSSVDPNAAARLLTRVERRECMSKCFWLLNIWSLWLTPCSLHANIFCPGCRLVLAGVPRFPNCNFIQSRDFCIRGEASYKTLD